ncbi:MAG: type II secretion system protein [Candidatus Sumerlaeota bacterium]
MQRRHQSGFTLVECIIAVAICSILFLATLSALNFARVHNELEQERNRAHQIVCQYMEEERFRLFSWTQSESEQTIWDNGTPENTEDDTIGTLEVEVRDPETGAVLTMAPNPARMVEIEVALSWEPRVARLKSKTLRESAVILKSP